MATIKKKVSKAGVISYKIDVAYRDNGKRVTRSMTYVPESGMSDLDIEKELNRTARLFEKNARAGKVESRSERSARDANDKKVLSRSITFKEFVEDYYKPKRYPKLSITTIGTYNYILSDLYDQFGNKLITDITTNDIENAMTQWCETLKASTVNAKIFKLKDVLSYAQKLKIIQDDPSSDIHRIKQPKDEQVKKKAFSVAEVLLLKRAFAREPMIWRCMFEILLDTGARLGEILALRWRCIDFENKVVTIDRTISQVIGIGKVVHATKTGARREIEIGNELIELLKKMLPSDQRDYRDDYVFNHDGIPYSSDRAWICLHEIAKKAGITDFHPHQLRHTSASIAVQGGADILGVSKRLGHLNLVTTVNMYLHSEQEQSNRAGRALREVLNQTDKE